MELDFNLQSFIENEVVEKSQNLLSINIPDLQKELCRCIPEKYSIRNISEIYNFIGNYCYGKINMSLEYDILAARFILCDLYNLVSKSIKENMFNMIYYNKAKPCKHIDQEILDIVTEFENVIQNALNFTKDCNYGYMSLITFKKLYLTNWKTIIRIRKR